MPGTGRHAPPLVLHGRARECARIDDLLKLAALRPVTHLLDDLPERQGAALAAALGLRAPEILQEAAERSGSVTATLELTLGRPEAAMDRLLPLVTPGEPNSNPMIALWSIPDVVEAAARCGRLDEVLAALDRYADYEMLGSANETVRTEVTRCRYATAATENTGGSRVATVSQLAPASSEPNTSPDVAPK
jgi:hypothetical protein